MLQDKQSCESILSCIYSLTSSYSIKYLISLRHSYGLWGLSGEKEG